MPLIKVKKRPEELVAEGFKAREESPEAARQFIQEAPHQEETEYVAPRTGAPVKGVRAPTDEEFRNAWNLERKEGESIDEYRQRIIDAAAKKKADTEQMMNSNPSMKVKKATLSKLESPVAPRKKPEEDEDQQSDEDQY